MSIHTASRIDTRLAVARVSKVRVRVRLASQASCVYLPRMAIHTAMGEASRVYSINLNTMTDALFWPRSRRYPGVAVYHTQIRRS